MNEDRFNMDIRKFLKVVGVTSQREIETAVRDALAQGRLVESALLKPRVTLSIPELGIEHVVDGEIGMTYAASTFAGTATGRLSATTSTAAIASPPVRAVRGPVTGSAKQSRSYFAAVTMISTRISGRARSAFTQARAGGFSGSTQTFHTEFMSANNAMSLIHRLADSRFDLLVPAWAR